MLTSSLPTNITSVVQKVTMNRVREDMRRNEWNWSPPFSSPYTKRYTKKLTILWLTMCNIYSLSRSRVALFDKNAMIFLTRGIWRRGQRIIDAFSSLSFIPPFALFIPRFFVANFTHCLKIAQNVAFEFWHFPPIFVLLKLTCLVTLFDQKLQVCKNSPKWTIFGIFD